jgi:uncharacterized protein (TIGR00369 family)
MFSFIPKDKQYEAKVKDSFESQQVMETVGARVLGIMPGQVELEFGYHTKLTQQHGFIHAGIVSTVLDSTCGYAAFSLIPKDTSVLTIEFKINLFSPAQGEKFIAIGKVKKAGRTITVCVGYLFAVSNNQRKLVATMTGTLMTIPDRGDLNSQIDTN